MMSTPATTLHVRGYVCYIMPVILFEKLNKINLGYFIPKRCFFLWKKINSPGDLPKISSQTATLPLPFI